MLSSFLFLSAFLASQSEQSKHEGARDRDHAVMEAVLKDLLTLSPKESPLWNSQKPDTKLYFRAVKLPVYYKLDDIAKPLHEQDWANLKPAQLQAVREAAENLFDRRSDTEPLKGFNPSEKRVVVFPNELAEKEQERRLGYMQKFFGYSPGYSKDGQTALVGLHFSWSIHGGAARYVLSKQKNGWIVLIGDNAIYP